MITTLVLAAMLQITLFVWLGVWLLPVMMVSIVLIGVLVWREGSRWENIGLYNFSERDGHDGLSSGG